MDKRYQVFLSSTYVDLTAERRSVIQTLMEMDCIPAGMELFPAADEEQFSFIKRIIDDCDYYLLIVGGRYGSLAPDGVSYTEKEYDYAVSKGIKVCAFVHDKPEEIPAGRSELNPESRGRLSAFRNKVATGRMVKHWSNPSDLPGLVALSLQKTMKLFPAVGWVRASSLPSAEVLNRFEELRLENEKLRRLISERTPKLAGLADLNEKFTGHGRLKSTHSASTFGFEVSLTWAEIFAGLAPYLLSHPADSLAKIHLQRVFYEAHKTLPGARTGTFSSFNDQDLESVKVQLMALNLITVTYSATVKGGAGLFWNLTSAGEQRMLELRTLKASE